MPSVEEAAARCPSITVALPFNLRRRRLTVALAALSGMMGLHFCLVLGKGARPFLLNLEPARAPFVDDLLSISLLVLVLLGVVWLAWMSVLVGNETRRNRVQRILKPVKVPGRALFMAFPTWAVIFEVVLDIDELWSKGGFSFGGWSNEALTFAAFAFLFFLVAAYGAWYRLCLSKTFSISPVGFVPTVYGKPDAAHRRIPWAEVIGAELILGKFPNDGSPRPFEWILQTRRNAICELTSSDLSESGIEPETMAALGAAVRAINDSIEAKFPSTARRAPLAKKRPLPHM